MSDLITKKSGVPFANSELRNKEIQRVIDYVLRPYWNNIHKDDLHQECWLYALEKEIPFEGTMEEYAKYLKVSLEGVCKNFVNPDRGSNRVNMNPYNTALDEVVFEKDDYSITRADLLEDEIDLESQIIARDLLKVYTKYIPLRDLTILNLLHEGYTPEDIVSEFQELGIKSERHIFRILKSYKNDCV